MSQSTGWIRQGLLGLALLTLLPKGAAAEPVTLNFQEADLRAVVETVSEATGKNFVVDPRVKGQVTLVSSQPLEGEAVYEAFLSVLDVHGFTAVPDGETVQIVPSSRAKQGAIPTDGGGTGGEFVTRVVAVEHVPAAQLVPILRPLVAQEGHMAAYQPTNTLILSDRGRNADRLIGIVESLDRPDQGRSKVIELEQAAAEEVVRIVEQMEQVGGQDQSGEGPRIVADSRTNSVIIRGDPDARMRVEALVHHLDTPVSTEEGNTHVIYLRYARAEEIIKVLQGLPEGDSGGEGEGGPPVRSPFSGVRMQADEGTNALVITAPPNRMRAIRSVINRLDIRRAQVMVEAIIAEVSVDRSREFGIQWLVDGTGGSGTTPAGAVNFSTGNSGIVPLASSIAQGGGANLGDGISAAFGQVGGAGTDFAGLVRALSSDSNVNVLSTPSLVTLDNEEAEIVVGQNQPFVTGQYTSTGSGSTPNNPFQTIQREDVGLTLKVSPQINEGSAVRLAIEQEVSSVLENTDTGPVTNKRQIKTNVIVDDGRILVLGGLIDEEEQVNEQRVPLLGDIPILGWLFRYNKTSMVKRNLMIFLRPTILRDGQDATRVSSAKYSALRERQLESRDSLRRLGDSDASPLLEEMDEFLELPPPYEGGRSKGGDQDGGEVPGEVPEPSGARELPAPDVGPAPVGPPASAARDNRENAR